MYIYTYIKQNMYVDTINVSYCYLILLFQAICFADKQTHNCDIECSNYYPS